MITLKTRFAGLLLVFLAIFTYNSCNLDDDTPLVTDEIALQEVASNLVSPVAMAVTPNPDDSRLFIVEQTGQVKILEDGSVNSVPFLDISDKVVSLNASYDERGLLGLAFHPNYAENRRFFVFYSAPLRAEAPSGWDNTSKISEFRASSDDPNRADPNSEKVILSVDQPQFNHAGGTLAFGPDGFLYISLGDGGGANDTGMGHVSDWYDTNEGGNAQQVENLLGSILRIDVDGGDPYGIPMSNPFVGFDGRDEIFAYGLRNPYRMSFDLLTGELFASDAGQLLYEEVNLIVNGGNYGWNVKEGTRCFNAADNKQPLDDCPEADPFGTPLSDPIIEFRNSSGFPQEGLGVVVVGGYLYRGGNLAGLQGTYIFGTYAADGSMPSGEIFYATPSNLGQWPITGLSVKGTSGQSIGHYLKAFGQDKEGELYALVTDNAGPTGNTGKVYKLVRE